MPRRSFIRRPSLKKRGAARTSWKRAGRHGLGFKAKRSYGWFTNPRRAAYNRVYYRTSRGCVPSLLLLVAATALLHMARNSKHTDE